MKHFLSVLIILLPVAALAQPMEMPTSAQKADKAVRASNGTLVRVVGAEFDKDAAVTEGTDVGDVVEVQVDGRAMCNVVIYAKPVNKSEFYKDKDGKLAELVGTMPNVLDLDFAEGVRGCYMMPGSCDGAGVCVWNVLLRGEECRKVGALQHYVASTLKEMWDLPSVRERMLVTDGLCGDEGDVPCSVAVGDPKAIPNRRVRFPHGWAGRFNDLNYRQRQKGKYLDRVRPDKLDADGKVILRGVGGPP